jgi:DNA polymerase-3 subunit delta'
LINDDEIIRKDNIRQDLDIPVLIRRSNYLNMIYCRAGELNPTTKNRSKGIRSKDIRVDQVRAFCEALNKTAEINVPTSCCINSNFPICDTPVINNACGR